MTDFEWLDSGPNCSEGHYSIHSKNPHLSPSLYTTPAVNRRSYTTKTQSRPLKISFLECTQKGGLALLK